MGLSSAVKARRAQLILLAVTLVVVAGAFEIFLRVTDRFPVPPYPVVPQDPEVYRQYDWGYGLLPNATLTERHGDDRTFTYHSNRHGFRGRREIDESDERTRILFAGDSFVFGWGVEKKERFTDVLEERRPDWRCDNIGMNGYGVDLTLRALEQVGFLSRPDVVVLSIYSDAFPRVMPHFVGMGYEVPRFDVSNGELESVPHPTHYPWDRLRMRQFVRRGLWSWRGTEWKINGAVLERFFEHARQRGFRPVVMFFAGFWPDSGVDRERRRFLEASCAEHGIDLLDVSAVRDLGRERAFIGIHWNEVGHAWVAEKLERFLAERLDAEPPR